MSTRTQNRSKTVAKVALISLIGTGVALLANAKNISAKLADEHNVKTLQPQTIKGAVNKTVEVFSLMTPQGQQYHVYDPESIIDELAKQRGIYSHYYQMDRVCIKGLISKVGSYGHLGQFERQLTVTGRCD
ncbi:hypothetical protein [Psychrobacter sp. I-STPA10]|uniref:hypothetical protein n=1 Tax=Psychrobacter sp. I-STPA10 TaxID=2585769 RepID=UPI001E39EDD2|nr:hypothetical protein [Psychrobacter sp. I-STPA10]